MKYILFILILLISCEEKAVIKNRRYAGQIIDVEFYQGGWSSFDKTKLKTDKAVFIIYGHHSFLLGDSIYIRDNSLRRSGREICTSGFCYGYN